MKEILLLLLAHHFKGLYFFLFANKQAAGVHFAVGLCFAAKHCLFLLLLGARKVHVLRGCSVYLVEMFV